MEMCEGRAQGGQSIILVALILLGLAIFAAIAVDLSNAYVCRRTAQNAADGAALAAARQLAYQINHDSFNDAMVQIELNDFAERNGVPDTDGIPANGTNANVAGLYLDETGQPIDTVRIGDGIVPDGAWGIDATAYITAPSFFGGIVGFDGYPVQAEAAVLLQKACTSDCVVPIATHTMAFTTTATCYNIWNGSGPGNFGWLNWTWQRDHCSGTDCPLPCHQRDCDTNCLAQNLDPDHCRSGFIKVDDWAAGTTGVTGGAKVEEQLDHYIFTPQEFTVIVWDYTNEQQGCGPWPNGLHYHVAGFARMQLIGYQLSQGQGKTKIVGDPGLDCVTMGEAPNNGFRLTARFLGWVEGGGGTCRAVGTVRAPVIYR